MKKNYLMLFASALVCMIACNKEIDLPNDDSTGQDNDVITEVISAGLEISDTKADVDGDLKFSWRNGADRAGDYVAFWNGTTFVRSAASTTAGASTTFEITYAGTRSEYAYYPYYIVQDMATAVDGTGKLDLAGTTTVVLPDTYDIQEVSGTNTPCPMIAVNTPESGWAFKQLCGLLRLTIKGIPDGTRKLTVKFNGNNVSGAFEVNDYDTNAPYLTSSRTLSDDIITINSESDITTPITVNIPLPAGTYSDISVIAYDSEGNGTIAFVGNIRKNYTTQAIARKAVGARTITLNNNKFFSIQEMFYPYSGGKKYALFAPGNLQYQASSGSWRFADHQYDFVGDEGTTAGNVSGSNNLSVSSSYSGWIDLFCWGTSGWTGATTADESWVYFQPWTTSQTNLYDAGDPSTAKYAYNLYGMGPYNKQDGKSNLTGKFANGDWGVYNTIDNYLSGTWRTPTGGTLTSNTGEWGDILTRRETGVTVNGTSNARYTLAEISLTGSSVKGMILFPDNYSGGTPAGVTWGLINGSSASRTTCTQLGWEALEDAGCIFLPAAGLRKNDGSLSYSAGNGFYWSSTAYAGTSVSSHPESHRFALRIGITDNNTNVGPQVQCRGYSVRLIRDLN